MEYLHQNVLNVQGKEVETRVCDQNVYSFGPVKAEAVHLKAWSEVNGFFNALGDVMDGAYKIIEVGFHSKISWAELPIKWDEEEDQVYVDFDYLENPEILARLERAGIKQMPDRHGWLVLKTYHGRLFPQGYVSPKTTKELLGERKREEISPMEWDRNQEAWNKLHKHNGVHLVQMISMGLAKVVCAFQARTGFEWQERSVYEKYLNLYKSAETRKEKRMGVIERAQAQRGLNVSTYFMQQDPAKLAEAQESTAGGVQIFDANGEPVVVQATELVGKRVVYVLPDKSERRGGVYLSEINRVRNAVLYAKTNGLTLQVKPLR